jgi:hypothetical protein
MGLAGSFPFFEMEAKPGTSGELCIKQASRISRLFEITEARPEYCKSCPSALKTITAEGLSRYCFFFNPGQGKTVRQIKSCFSLSLKSFTTVPAASSSFSPFQDKSFT